MKLRQKFPYSRIGRVLPFAITCLIAAEFVACGNKNGARELITQGKISIGTQSTKAASDPAIAQRILGATAAVATSTTDPKKFNVTVRLLMASRANPSSLLVIVANNPAVSVAPAAAPATPPQASVDASLDGATSNPTNTASGPANPSVPAQNINRDELKIDPQSSSRDLAQNGAASLRAVCADATCSKLAVTYFENATTLTASALGNNAGIKSGVLQGVASANAGFTANTAAQNTVRGQGRVDMIFGGDASSMTLEACAGATATGRVCDKDSFDKALEKAKTDGRTISPTPGQSDPTAGSAGAGAGAAGGQPAPTTPPQVGSVTTGAAQQQQEQQQQQQQQQQLDQTGGPASPAAGVNGADGAQGALDAVRQ